MKKHLLFLHFAFILFTFSSCLSTKELMKDNTYSGNTIENLNGIYKNIAANLDDPKSEHPLYVVLFKEYYRKTPYGNKDRDYEGKIKIEVISNKKIRVDYIVEDHIEKSKTYKGKIKNNLFVSKRKWRILGIPMFLGVYDESKLTIGISETGYLNVRKGLFRMGGLIVLANAEASYDDYFYEKME